MFLVLYIKDTDDKTYTYMCRRRRWHKVKCKYSRIESSGTSDQDKLIPFILFFFCTFFPFRSIFDKIIRRRPTDSRVIDLYILFRVTKLYPTRENVHCSYTSIRPNYIRPRVSHSILSEFLLNLPILFCRYFRTPQMYLSYFLRVTRKRRK